MKKGKNFSCNNISGLRKKSDFYETPYSITRQLMEHIHADFSSILEPACGGGAIVKVLKEFGYKGRIRFYDIETGTNFLNEKSRYAAIITNPPFSLAEEFIEHALTISNDCYFLLPLSYLHGKKRYDKFYSQNMLSEIFVFTRYPMLGDPLRDDGKYRTGMMVYAWFHFSHNCDLATTIEWLDNNEFVLNKKDLL